MDGSGVTARPSLTLRRTIKAPPDRVFSAWTQAAQLSRWFCPADCTLESVENDPRPGGRYAITMRSRDSGETHRLSGTDRAFDPPQRLIMTWAWYTMPERESLVTVDIAATDGGSVLTLTHAQFADTRARDGHRVGWTGMLDHLAELLEAGAAAC
ncbi:MAG: SRPBCC family protein [Hyphomicrobiaceae bacterium]